MNLIQKFSQKIHHYFLAKERKNYRAERASTDFDRAKTVGILFDATDLNRREYIQKYVQKLEKKGKNVKLLGFINASKGIENLAFDSFSRKEMDWVGRPKKAEVFEFMRKDFDILINISLEEMMPLEYITTLSQAKFRVGPYTELPACYELMLDVSKSKDVRAFTDQAMFFLDKMNKGVMA